MSWLAPAKINRFLHITGQREDGYHELQTVFQFLDFADELNFNVLKTMELIHNNPLPDVPAEDDLIIKAARLLQQHANCHLGMDVSINKKLPMGGGLGGGSSDAATTLVALNQLWNLKIELPDLAKLGLQLGADVPIFIYGVAAWAEGIGEDISPIILDEPYFVVLIPAVSVSTADIFSSPILQRNCTSINLSQFMSGEGTNVCEDIVCELYPEVGQTLQWLGQYSKATMTGTGACVFASFSTEAEAEQVLQQMPEQFNGFVAKGLNISPLYS